MLCIFNLTDYNRRDKLIIMKCNSCNHQNENGAKFCGGCGSPMLELDTVSNSAGMPEVQNVAPTSATIPPVDSASNMTVANIENVAEVAGNTATVAQNKPPLKKILMVVVPTVLLIIAIIVLANVFSRPNIMLVNNHIEFFDYGDSVVVVGNNNAPFTVDGRRHSVQTSMDGSKAVILTDHNHNDGGTLWFVTTREATRIKDGVFDYFLATSGNGVALITDRNGNTGDLYLHNTSSMNTSRIAEEIELNQGKIVISPDGRSVGYVGEFDNDSNEFTGYVSINGGSPERLSENSYAIAISNGGRLRYYVNYSRGSTTEASLHVQRRGCSESERLTPRMSRNEMFLQLNYDYSEAIFHIDRRAHLSRNGGERERISSRSIVIVLPDNAMQHGRVGLFVLGVRSFTNTTVLTAGERLEFLNRHFETQRISGINRVGDVVISDDATSLVYIDERRGTLLRVSTTNENADSTELARDASSLVASSDLNVVYFVNDMNELWFVRGNREPSRIAEDVDSRWGAFNRLTIFEQRAFFISDYVSINGGDLYYSNNGRSRQRIARDVTRVWSTPTSVFYETTDGEIFRSNDGSNFSLVFEGDVTFYEDEPDVEIPWDSWEW